MERFQEEMKNFAATEPAVASPLHGSQCQCLTCKLDEYKKKNGAGWSWSFISQDYSSLCTGAFLGSAITLVGVALFRQWRQQGFGSMSSQTVSSKTLSNEPIVLINNATDTLYNIVSVDPSVGILYAATTALYDIDVQVNLLLPESVHADRVVRVFVAKNGLPTDSSAVLLSAEQGLSSGFPEVISLKGMRLLKCDDYIQVFALLEGGGTVPINVLASDFAMKMGKVQKAES